jgi:hypothetical protein
MMGAICNLLIGFLEVKSDKETVEEIKKKAGLAGREFKTEQIYPEEEWQSLLNAACDVLDVDRETAEKLFAENVIGELIDKFGSYFRASDSALSLLKKVPKIHIILPASMGLTTQEKIKLVTNDENKIIYHYNSPNKLCIFLKTLAEQVFKYYNETGYNIVENQCIKQGADYCEIIISTK